MKKFTSYLILTLFLWASAPCVFSQQNAVRVLSPAGERKAVYTLSERSLKKGSLPEAVRTVRTERPGVSGRNAAGGVYIEADYSSEVTVDRSPAVDLVWENDTVLRIENFWGTGNTLAVRIDPASHAISIAPQEIMNHPTYGPCFIYAIDFEKNQYDPTATITGTIEGDVVILSSWACVITSGTYEGFSFGAYLKSEISPSNGTMQSLNYSTEPDPGLPDESPVLVEQFNANTLRVFNFAGTGHKVDITLKGDSSMAIAPQFLFTHATYGDFYCYPADWTSGVYFPLKPILGKAGERSLNWGNWIISASKGNWYKRYVSTTLSSTVAFRFPPVQPENFTGEGTAEDPYRIESVTDLLRLSEQVNSDTLVADDGTHTHSFIGKYFLQTADLDLAEYSLSPIGGKDGFYRFAGIYDGNGKKIRNLSLIVPDGYCGLFGAIDTLGVVKNVTLEDCYLESGYAYLYTGSVAGYCMGTLDNCHATGTINTTGYCVGGIVGGISGSITRSSFSGTVTGSTQTGGVVGVAYGPVSGLWSDASVTSVATIATSSVGGVIGTSYGTYNGSVSGCYFAGTVSTKSDGMFAGGVAGVAQGVTVDRCFNVGSVVTKGAQSGAGGVVGAANGATISNCYHAGTIDAMTTKTSGILGYGINGQDQVTKDSLFIRIENCYVSTPVNTRSVSACPVIAGDYPPNATILNCYFDGQITENRTNGSLSTSAMTSGNGLPGFDDGVWNFTAGMYPRIEDIDEGAAAVLSAAPVVFADQNMPSQVTADFKLGGTSEGVVWKATVNGALTTEARGFTIRDSVAVLNGTFANDTLVAICGGYKKAYVLAVAPSRLFEGEGTEESPYLLSTKEDLINLSVGTSENRQAYDGVYFRMTNDIDLEYAPEFIGISSNTDTSVKFGGVFDGNGYAIRRCRLITVNVIDENTVEKGPMYRGFIGRLKSTGVVRNLSMADDCDFKFWSYSAAIVGYAEGGRIENCRNYAPVTGYSGTIAGIVSYMKEGGTISNCYNSGRISTGNTNAAGIVVFNRGTLENCQNDGEISAEVLSSNFAYSKLSGAGGIAYSNFGVIRNALNTGYIHAPKYVGGILGMYNNTKEGASIAENSINIGRVQADDETAGQLVGRLYRDGGVVNFYYDSQFSVTEAAHGDFYAGCIPMTTARLTAGIVPDGLDAGIWQFEAGRYPALKLFAGERGAKAASVSVVYFNEPERCDSLKTDAVLGQAEGLSWTLKTGSGFLIDQGKLCIVAAADQHSDTLVALYEGFRKEIPVTAVPDTLPAPVIDVTDGDRCKIVTLTCTVPEATIRYTTDGTEPTFESAFYTEPLKITKSCLIKAYAVNRANYDSPVAEESVYYEDALYEMQTGSRVYVADGYLYAGGAKGIEICDSAGKPIRAVSGQDSISVTGLNTGVYLVRITGSGSSVVYKIVLR